MNINLKSIFNYLGIISSSLCIVHCIITPTLLLFGRLIFQSIYVDLTFIIVSLISVMISSYKSRNKIIKSLLWFFFSLFAISILFESQLELFHIVGIISSIGLMIIHILNIKNCKSCPAQL